MGKSQCFGALLDAHSWGNRSQLGLVPYDDATPQVFEDDSELHHQGDSLLFRLALLFLLVLVWGVWPHVRLVSQNRICQSYHPQEDILRSW
jgi:hypothetical protein